ncbi:MAG: c-type cytochrome biogenesis protein CcmI [Pseudohongiella sp.]
MFWVLTVGLLLLASLFIILPVWLRSREENGESAELRKEANIALFHERSFELENDLSAGNLDQGQFDSLLIELQKSLLADTSFNDQDEPASIENFIVNSSQKKTFNKVSNRKNKKKDSVSRLSATNLIPVILAMLIPVLAYSLYDQWGYIDDVELMGLFQRALNSTGDPGEAQALVESLVEATQADEERPWAWYFLGENFANLSMFAESESVRRDLWLQAMTAYQQSSVLFDEGPEKAFLLGRVALAKYMNSGREFNQEILDVIEQAREINPNENTILQLLAADAEQREDYTVAIQYWRLLIQANPNSAEAQMLRQKIATEQQVLAANGEEIDVGPIVEINLSVADGIVLDENLRVFVAVRNAAREGMPPLAATDLRVSNLPQTIQLDNSSAVGPFNLASSDTVYVSALVSFAGVANPQIGDYRVVSENFSHNGQHTIIDLLISEQVQ